MTPQHVYQPVPFGQGAAEIVVHDPANPMVLVQDPANPNQSIAIPRSQLVAVEATPARDLAPRPAVEPIAQRFAAAGVGVGVAAYGSGHLAWGAAQVVAAMSGVGSALGSAALLVAVWKLAPGQRGGKRVVNVTNKNSWGGRSTTRM
ncbi:hypothetical protein [Streptomyces sp. 039-1]|uniref:hypothetical protein n=1 Tax=Streptomyces sp. 039-1 TaxID=2789263 RepID=UPI0039F473D1